MKKNRSRSVTKKNHVQPSPALVSEMRGLVQATRARSALRSLTPTEAKARINALEKETLHEYKSSKRQVPHGSMQGTQVPRRSTTDQLTVHGERLPAPVRHLFQDARRALVCSSRETRREVMFAMRRAGKAGSRRNRKARWTSNSYVSCKGK